MEIYNNNYMVIHIFLVGFIAILFLLFFLFSKRIFVVP